MIGQTLAHYKILEKIGSGGMGDVYLAEDTKLDRKVALKVLPPDLAGNEERRARFQREAKAIAALDHPNIVQVFSVEEAEGTHFITMQLVQGKTLTELLPKNGFPLNKFFDIAIPLADAVATAHQEGITHRDLKPDNIMVTDEGRVKVLDFGLAKPTGAFVASEGPTAVRTEEGVIVGTVAYMSPEQAEGKQVDHRSDIFSIGIMLYEMATGQRPFQGDTAASIISSILKDTPVAVTELNPKLPSELSKILRRCLVKDPEHRYQSAKDVRNELEELKQDVDSGVLALPISPSTETRWTRPFAVSVVLALVAGVLLYISRPSPQEVPRLTNPVQVTSAVGVEDYPSWSPDGRTLAYESNQSGNWDIWVKQVGGGPPQNRTADYSGADRSPSWSPDGNQIAFWSARDGGAYMLMSALGGAPRKVASARESDPPQWFGNGEGLAFRASANDDVVEILSLRTGESRRVSLPGSRPNRMDLSWSPDQHYIAYVDTGGIMTETTQLWLVNVEDGEGIPLTEGTTNDWSPSWTPDGTLYFVSNRGGSMDLWQQRLRISGEPVGSPQPVTTGIGMRRAAFSRDGNYLAYSKGRRVANLWRVPILTDAPATWVDAEQLTRDHAFIEFVDISREGDRLVFNSDRLGDQDLWVMPGAGGEMQRLTADPTMDWCPRLSPDGKEVVFYSNRSGNRDIWVMPLVGGPARQVTRDEAFDAIPEWSPDGRQIAFRSERLGNSDIWVVSAEGGELRQITQHEALDVNPQWSPDGQWLAFGSDRTGERRIWKVRAGGGTAEPVTNGPAGFGRWAPDGLRFYFTGIEQRAGNIWVVSLEDGSERPVTDFEGRTGTVGYFGLATDGRHLYFTWEEDIGDIWVMDVVTEED